MHVALTCQAKSEQAGLFTRTRPAEFPRKFGNQLCATGPVVGDQGTQLSYHDVRVFDRVKQSQQIRGISMVRNSAWIRSFTFTTSSGTYVAVTISSADPTTDHHLVLETATAASEKACVVD